MSLGPLPALPTKARLTTLPDSAQLKSTGYLLTDLEPGLHPPPSEASEHSPDQHGDTFTSHNHPVRNGVAWPRDDKSHIRKSPPLFRDSSLSKSEPHSRSDEVSESPPSTDDELSSFVNRTVVAEDATKTHHSNIVSGTDELSRWHTSAADDRTSVNTGTTTRDGLPSAPPSPSDLPRQATSAASSVARSVSLPGDTVPDQQGGRRDRRDVTLRQLSSPGEQCGRGAGGSQYWRGHVTVLPSPEGEEFVAPVRKKMPHHPEVEESMSHLPITRAILKGDKTLVLECLRQGEDPKVVCSKTGQTFLHVTAWSASMERELHWVPVIYQLSNAGVDLDPKDVHGVSPVLVAIRRKLLNIVSALLKCGAELAAEELEEAERTRGVVRADMLETVRRFTPTYWHAVLDTTSFKVRRLVKAWARINVSRGGQTLLEFAKQKAQNPDVVRLLSQNEASVELAHAVLAGDCDRACVLMCDGSADLGTSDCSVRSASMGSLSPLSLIDWAERLGHTGMVKLLTDRKCGQSGAAGDRQSGDEYERTLSQRMSDGTTSALCVIV